MISAAFVLSLFFFVFSEAVPFPSLEFSNSTSLFPRADDPAKASHGYYFSELEYPIQRSFLLMTRKRHDVDQLDVIKTSLDDYIASHNIVYLCRDGLHRSVKFDHFHDITPRNYPYFVAWFEFRGNTDPEFRGKNEKDVPDVGTYLVDWITAGTKSVDRGSAFQKQKDLEQICWDWVAKQFPDRVKPKSMALYDLLGVKSSATNENIEKAYR